MIEQRRNPKPACCAPQAGIPPVLLLASEPQSARTARTFVREYVDYHVPGASEDHVDTVVLVTCELVTNSIRYGTEPGGSLSVVINADEERTRVEVHDPVHRRPRPRPESTHRDRGRGLLILDALCPGQWGVTNRPHGKAVWAEVKAT
ncbi:ATP-binding protein [Streptomyces sp. XD-27]|uniref:ATP-binding protein n=1 Tax=Streptomyces sp. XD-27 TaxID=3062779 RepID=UPI0026F420EB|nr:ATP-binding protein [Streptomyces sp. XD-27]WKX70352.1 ATP-binding protein [Streptomyces sp. XD-27]